MPTEATHLTPPTPSAETITGPFTSLVQSGIDVIALNLPRDLHRDVLTITLVIATLVAVFGETPALQSNYAWMLLYSLVTFLCYDFVFFSTHYTMQRVPALWALHKIHHSAEVLTPLTRYREHFLVGPLWAAGGALSYGFAAGIFAYLFNGGIIAARLCITFTTATCPSIGTKTLPQ